MDEPTDLGRQAMRALHDAALRGAQAMHEFHLWMQLVALGLDDWDDEMTNCYPNWPEG